MIKIFDTLEKYNTYTNNGQNLESGFLYYVKEDNSTHYYTNNIDGVSTIYDTVETPSGNIEITENAESLDIAEYASATVAVPIPEGYIIPTGNKEITQNGTGIDVAQYATATVNVASQAKNYIVEGTEYDPTATYSGAFDPKTQIATVTIPNGFTSIAKDAFYKIKIDNLTIPSSVTTFNTDAFQYCYGLTNGLTIPSTVRSIDYSAFEYSAIPALIMNSTTPPTINDSILNNWDGYILVPAASVDTYKAASGWSNMALRIFPLPNVSGGEIVLTIKKNGYDIDLFGNRQFQMFKKMYINDVEVNPTQRYYTVKTGDVIRCELFDQRSLPQYFDTYKNANGYIGTITLPSTIETIPDETICFTNYTSLTFLSTTPPTIGQRVFNSTNNCPIYVPAESVEAYKAASGWSSYASQIQAIPTGPSHDSPL